MNQDPGVMEYFPSLLSPDKTEQLYNRIQKHFEEHGFGLYALEESTTGAFIGFTGFMIPSFTAPFTPCVEIGWRLRKAYWGKGLASEAALACLEYGFSTWHFPEVYSFTSVYNTRSENVMKKIGMHKAGEFEHPNIPRADRLCRHVLYKIIPAG
ncbi:MAG: hypothetical protein RL732_838 [Bacteroidota bacterium]